MPTGAMRTGLAVLHSGNAGCTNVPQTLTQHDTHADRPAASHSSTCARNSAPRGASTWQPWSKASPPLCSRLEHRPPATRVPMSNTAARSPRLASCSAQARPATPPPITATSALLPLAAIVDCARRCDVHARDEVLCSGREAARSSLREDMASSCALS